MTDISMPSAPRPPLPTSVAAEERVAIPFTAERATAETLANATDVLEDLDEDEVSARHVVDIRQDGGGFAPVPPFPSSSDPPGEV